MAEIRKVKLSEQTADRLYEMIVDERRYTPGSKLPNENELSEELQVSRTTLREAISFLVAQGVLEIRRGKGTFVSDQLPAAGLDLTSLAGLRSRVRAKDLFEMRLIFEPATVALACLRATDDELAQIEKKAQWMEHIAAEGGDWPLADQEFHWAIIKASHNEYMRHLYPIINSAVNEIMQISGNRQQLSYLSAYIPGLVNSVISRQKAALDRASISVASSGPRMIMPARVHVDNLAAMLSKGIQTRLESARNTLDARAGLIEALSPQRVLARGFSLTRTVDGRTVTDAESLSAGDEIVTLLSRGSVRSRVTPNDK